MIIKKITKAKKKFKFMFMYIQSIYFDVPLSHCILLYSPYINLMGFQHRSKNYLLQSKSFYLKIELITVKFT